MVSHWVLSKNDVLERVVIETDGSRGILPTHDLVLTIFENLICLPVPAELPGIDGFVFRIKFGIGELALLLVLVDFQLLPVGEGIVHVDLGIRVVFVIILDYFYHADDVFIRFFPFAFWA